MSAAGKRRPTPRRQTSSRRTVDDPQAIQIRGARVHNLRSIDVEIPRDAITVITGVSGSGKSSLAFDTLFAEGQRQYIDSLSTYARQFLDQIPRPDVDSISGLAPTLAIDQKVGSTGSRSTVATVTEVYDYLRLLYARVGSPHCVQCGSGIAQQSADSIRDSLAALPASTKLVLLSPIVRGRRGAHREVFESIRSAGLIRVRVDGEMMLLDDVPDLAPRRNHTIEAVVDRLLIREGIKSRLSDSLELGLRLGDGLVTALVEQPDGPWQESLHSTAMACLNCGASFAEIEPRTFSFNSPYGACPECDGLGIVGESNRRADNYSAEVCPACQGRRLRPEALAVTIGDLAIDQLTAMSLGDAARWLSELAASLCGLNAKIAAPICRDVTHRLAFLDKVGVGYLTLDRTADTLSGGESQRVRLATSIGSGLVGVCYVLDEPSIGLHPADQDRLLDSLRQLQRQGNTVVVVEHDEATMRAADRLIDMGPGAGHRGGTVISVGTPTEVIADPRSLTGQYLRGERRIPIPETRRQPCDGQWLELANATTHNLKSVSARFPLGLLIGVSGVSGSGKSSLINDTLVPLLQAQLGSNNRFGAAPTRAVRNQVAETTAEFLIGDTTAGPPVLSGSEQLDKLILIDQAPIGRSPRSCPATYSRAFDAIRQVFAATREAKTRGFNSSRFSFNSAAGRCDQCRGHGVERIEMNFLSDLFVTCTRCGGKRFNRQTLQVRFKDATIADVLDMSIDEAADWFENVPKIERILRALQAVGLGYVQLGQSSTTLSGGEAQRIKLGTELARTSTGKTLYLLDEPTTGLHFEDIERLVAVLQRLVDQGNTVLVIEHQFNLLAACDWILDLGPEGGAAGGEILARGPPEFVAECPNSATGRYLRPLLDGVSPA